MFVGVGGVKATRLPQCTPYQSTIVLGSGRWPPTARGPFADWRSRGRIASYMTFLYPQAAVPHTKSRGTQWPALPALPVRRASDAYRRGGLWWRSITFGFEPAARGPSMPQEAQDKKAPPTYLQLLHRNYAQCVICRPPRPHIL